MCREWVNHERPFSVIPLSEKVRLIPQHGRQITQWNSMQKDIAFKINLIIFVSFYFVGIELICALRRDSVCKALSYLCHNIMKLSGME